MNFTTEILFENVCRTCMEKGTDKTISIFSGTDRIADSNATIIDLLILTIPQLNIETGDMLPKVLCESCLERLLNAYEFQNMCIRVEEKLRQMVNEGSTLKPQVLLDPLNDSAAVNQAINDLTNILKVEMDEPLICSDSPLANKKNGNEDVKFEGQSNQLSSDGSVKFDDDSSEKSEWEVHIANILKTKNRTKSNNNDDKSKYFTCDDCGNQLKTKKSLKRHKKIHLRPPLIDKKKDNEDVKFEAECKQLSSDGSVEFEGEESENEIHTTDFSISKRRHTTLNRKVKNLPANSSKTTEQNFDKICDTTSEIRKENNKNCNANNNKGDKSKNFVCDECGSCLKTQSILKRHKKIHLKDSASQKTNQIITKYECEFCKKVFQQSSSLKDHLRIHTGEQPYLCSECGKAFKSLSNMKQHFLRHGTDRPYVCPDCPKRFPCLSDLASHKIVHNNKKSHVCDICGSGFSKPYLLKKHKMYHTGEKNHKCDYCEMRFVLADQCRRHMRTHTGEKPYKCKYCVRAFAQSNDLIKHLRGHLGDNVYKCDLCPQGFRLQGDLRAHFYTHKNDDEETRARNLQALKDEEQRIHMKFGIVDYK